MLSRWVQILVFVQVAVASFSFNVLTYNVAGLPEAISSSNPAENTPHISSRLGPYSIINVQEDFNYHAALYASNKHAHRTPTSGGVPFGDGLNTLSDFPYIDFERVKWSKCNFNSGDCLTPKGFSALKVRLRDGVYVDVYNLHTDAGGDSGDYAARKSNVEQLLDYMKTYSSGMPVVVMGDTNMRYTTAADSMRLLAEGGGLTDAWVQLAKNGRPPAAGAPALVCPFPFGPGDTDYNSCETVDKILSKSSPAAELKTIGYNNDHARFLHPTSVVPLSDHYPHSAVFAVEPRYHLADPHGGPHGDWFSDTAALGSSKTVSSIAISGGNRLDRVSVTYTDGSSATHGGSGGTETRINLASSGNVTRIRACQNKHNNRTRIFFLEITTSNGSRFSSGKEAGECKTWTPPSSGSRLVGFWGRSGTEIDRIAPVWSI